MSLEDKQEIAVAAPAVESTSGRIRVLAVDDSPFSRKLLEHALRGQPYELAFAKNGQEALASIVTFRPKSLSPTGCCGFIRAGAVSKDTERVGCGIYVRNSTYEQCGEREHCGRVGGRRG